MGHCFRRCPDYCAHCDEPWYGIRELVPIWRVSEPNVWNCKFHTGNIKATNSLNSMKQKVCKKTRIWVLNHRKYDSQYSTDYHLLFQTDASEVLTWQNSLLFGIYISVHSEMLKLYYVTQHTFYIFKFSSLNLLPRVLSPRLHSRDNLNHLIKYTKAWETYKCSKCPVIFREHFYSELPFHWKFYCNWEWLTLNHILVSQNRIKYTLS